MENKLENQQPISKYSQELDKVVTAAGMMIGEVRKKVEKFNKEAFKSDLSKKTKESFDSLLATIEKFKQAQKN